MTGFPRCISFTLRWLFIAATFAGAAAHAGTAPPPPEVEARAYVLEDFHSGAMLAERNATERMEPASITKLMTAYVVFDALQAGKIALTDPVTISEKAWRMEGSRTFVQTGSRVPVETLLKGMIVQSGNDATVALAEHVAGGEDMFAAMMNQHAQALGLASSHFMNSTGLPHPEHYTTARDIATLARALIQRFPDYYKWYSMREFTYNGITQPNRNLLLTRTSFVDGMKTGHTESAGYCLVSSGVQDHMRLISVVLGTASEEARADISETLLNYGFRFYETKRVYDARQSLSQLRVWKGAQDTLPLGLAQPLHVTLPRGRYNELKAAIQVPDNITAPVAASSPLGTLTISLDGRTLISQPLIALSAVEEGNLFQRLADEVRLWLQ